jgi:glycosyltransferase involved in cell wall biosynthesis
MTAAPVPRVSIIIPAYNSERYLHASLQSVLDQTYSDYEVIVVDDGSTDNTKASVLSLGAPVHYIYQPNAGPSAARNTGLAVAKGDLICFLDADDSWTPDKLKSQVSFMDEHPEVGLVFSDEEEYDEDKVHCYSLLSKSAYYSEIMAGGIVDRAFQRLLPENFVPTSMVMARRRCFETAGLFDVTLRGPEDRDMWSRIAAHFRIACLPQVLGRKRIVIGSVSSDDETTLRSRIRLWTKARRLFPDLVPVHTVNELLAPTYVQLGFLLLHKNNTREARIFGLKSFGVSRDPYQWFLALSLVIFSFTGRALADSAFRAKRWLLSRA